MRTKTAIISIDKLTAEAVPGLTEGFKTLAGVESVDFNVERSVAVVEFDPSQADLDKLLRVVLKAGFRPI